VKVLLSAYACLPEQGSEPGIGCLVLLAAARHHDVWVLTQPHMAAALGPFLADHPIGGRVHVEAVGPPYPAGQPGLRRLVQVNRHHDQWQHNAAARGRELDRRVGFDLVHHVTLAAFWMRVGVAALDKPLVWGPVGGAVQPPWPLVGELGRRGLVETGVRMAARPFLRRLVGRDAARRARVIFAQNRATASRIRSAASVLVLPNAVATGIERMPAAGPRTREVAVVGRLIPWKAGRLAVRAFRHVTDPGAVLTFYGDGPERDAVWTAARRWGLAGRVAVAGYLPRPQLLARVAQAGALLHPALHEEAGVAVAEALTMGTPVVALAHGGPVELVGQWPASPAALVPPSWPEATARRLGAAVDRFLAAPPPVPPVPAPPKDQLAERVLEAYELATG
jgi:glycosyltransferase involved in cell wall biosynthesis